jgi:hypothetical protein
MKADSKLPFFAYSSEGILQQSLQIFQLGLGLTNFIGEE